MLLGIMQHGGCRALYIGYSKYWCLTLQVSEGGVGCSCNECEYMKMNTIKKIYNALKFGWPTVEVAPEIAEKAVKPIEKMFHYRRIMW